MFICGQLFQKYEPIFDKIFNKEEYIETNENEESGEEIYIKGMKFKRFRNPKNGEMVTMRSSFITTDLFKFRDKLSIEEILFPFPNENSIIKEYIRLLKNYKEIDFISIYDFLIKEKDFFISKIENFYEIEKIKLLFLRNIEKYEKNIKEKIKSSLNDHKEIYDFLIKEKEKIEELVENSSKEELWNLIGIPICDSFLKRKNKEKEIEQSAESIEYGIAEENVVQNDEYAKKIADLELKEKEIDEQRNELKKRMEALALVEEKYSNLLKELEEKISKNDKEEKIVEVTTLNCIQEMKIEEPKVEIIDGFSATESAIINHMEEVLRHKKGTQNVWIDDETDREHIFQSTIRLSRNKKTISNKKEILDYYKKSRNII